MGKNFESPDSKNLRSIAEELLKNKSEAKILDLIEELAFQNYEKSLKDSEEQFRLLFENSGEGILFTNPSGAIISANPEACRIFGYSEEEICLRGRAGLLDPSDVRLQNGLIERMETGRMQGVVNAIRKDGTVFPIEISSRIFTDSSGAKRTSTFLRDISDREKNEKMLQSSEALLRNITDLARDAIVMMDPDGRITFWNPAAEEMFGYRRDEAIGRIVHTFLAPARYHGAYFSGFPEFQKTGLGRVIGRITDFEAVRKDGKEISVQLSLSVNQKEGKWYAVGVLRDITESKKILEELRQTSARLTLATRAGGVGIWDLDLVNNVLSWDDQMYELYGINREYSGKIQEAWQMAIHPNDWERNEMEAQMALRGEKEYNTEFRIVRPDGSIRNIRAIAEVHMDASGRASRIFGTNWDITELRNAEKEKLDDSESRYRSIFNGSPDGIIITGIETKEIMLVNAAACEIFGYSEEVFKTMTILEINPPNTEGDILTEFESLARREKNLAENIQCQKKNGEIFYADIASCYITINGRKCIAGFFRDITSRRNTENAILINNNRLDNAMNVGHLAWWEMDVNTGTVLFDKRRIEMLGYPPGGFKHFEDIMALVHPDDYACTMNAMRGHLDGLFDRYDVEYRILTQSGEYRWFYDNGTIVDIDSNGKPLYISGISLDITERKLAELKIKEALVKAESGDRLKHAFLQNISHEVRTPLNGILGYGNLLAKPNLTDKEKHEYNSYLKASCDRLINTINDYIDISLLVSGNIEMERKPIIISALLEDLKTRFLNSCNIKNLAINLQIPPEQESVILITDEQLLHKIISGLLDNAIKFTSLGSITFGYSVKSKTIEFFVKDSGIGVAPEAQQRIFEPFMQENIANTRGYEGSGLGLSIIKGFLKLLGGEIHLKSEKGKGSLFFFSLPCETLAIEKNETISGPAKNDEIKNPIVLIVEDDLINEYYMEFLLEPITSTIFKASNGQSAIEICRLHPEISLVLMDMMMPVMDGYEATRQIKSFRKELTVIAVTAYELRSDKKKAFDAGCDDFLSKPVSGKELFEKLKKHGYISLDFDTDSILP